MGTVLFFIDITEEYMYDVAIIGAGPAGSTLARLLSNRYKVLLVDKRELEAEPQPSGGKCCGGLVAPDAQKAIAELGFGLPKKVIVGPQLFAVRTIDLTNKLERYYQRFYINIDREKFDRWLVSLAGSSETRFGCHFKGFERSTQSFTVRLSRNGREFTEQCTVLVGADGALSAVRKLSAPNSPAPVSYIAIQEWFHDGDMAPYFSAIFDDETTDFYSWTIPKDDLLLVGAALKPGADAPAKFERLKQKLASHGYHLGQPVRREGAFILRPVSTRQIFAGTAGVALVGEAAGFISPSSCEGLSYPFRSAAALATSLEKSIVGFEQIYSHNALDINSNILLKNLKSPFMYNRMIRGVVMKSGISSLKMI
jgi:geranylgeranyl diphosphate/geranylgeranyl-bacteriochlorophyllide a reductase